MADYIGGFKVIDVSNPANPVRIGYQDTTGWPWGVCVMGSYAYVVEYTAGLQVFDISYPDRPVLVGGYNTNGLAYYGVTVAGNYIYVADYGAGLQIFKVPSLAMNITPHAATATAQILNGFVVDTIITDSGCGYTNTPLITIEGDGVDATATAILKDGVVDKITINNPGQNYSTKNTFVLIASPPFIPEISIQVSKVKVNQKVVLGRKYQLETSYDITSWTPVGSEFIATRELIEQEFDVNQTGRYFRLKEIQ